MNWTNDENDCNGSCANWLRKNILELRDEAKVIIDADPMLVMDTPPRVMAVIDKLLKKPWEAI